VTARHFDVNTSTTDPRRLPSTTPRRLNRLQRRITDSSRRKLFRLHSVSAVIEWEPRTKIAERGALISITAQRLRCRIKPQPQRYTLTAFALFSAYFFYVISTRRAISFSLTARIYVFSCVSGILCRLQPNLVRKYYSSSDAPTLSGNFQYNTIATQRGFEEISQPVRKELGWNIADFGDPYQLNR